MQSVAANARLRQLRLPCVPKRQVDNAFLHLARITVCPLAFFPNSVDLVVVAAQIKGRVDTNRDEKNAITARPIALIRVSSQNLPETPQPSET